MTTMFAVAPHPRFESNSYDYLRVFSVEEDANEYYDELAEQYGDRNVILREVSVK